MAAGDIRLRSSGGSGNIVIGEDSSGASTTGTADFALPVQEAAGTGQVETGSIRFDSAADRVEFTNNPGPEFSAAFNFMVLSLTAGGGVFQHLFSADNGVDEWCQIGFEGNTGVLTFYTNLVPARPLTTIALNVSYAFSFRVDLLTGAARWFLRRLDTNVLLDGTEDPGTNASWAVSAVSIGGSQFNEPITARLSRVRLFTPALLTDEELEEETLRQDPAVVARGSWRFDTVATILDDTSGNANDLVNPGGAGEWEDFPAFPYPSVIPHPALEVAGTGSAGSSGTTGDAAFDLPAQEIAA
ncbi:MAG: hypothetical protein HC882_08250, partial [Acidobacteria bacterium]|nr:hypothetical protein [Acidobacteriota bacterium]